MVIYKITNRLNGKVYIGKTEATVESRWEDHVSNVEKGYSFHLTNAIRKYGVDAFDFTILDVAQSREELNTKEIYFIALYQSNQRERGYNMTPGGDGRVGPHTGEAKEKMRSAWTLERRKAQARRMQGVRKLWLGRHTLESRAAISTALIGRKLSEETKSKMSRAHRKVS